MKVWSLYIMAAPLRDGFTYFKVGISSNLPKRLSTVQCRCPLKITTMWAITLWGNGSAQHLESQLHEKLSPFRSHGEWFGMETNNADHKKAMKQAMDHAVQVTNQVRDGGWRKYSVSELRTILADYGTERKNEGRMGKATEKRKAMALMVLAGRNML